MFTLIARGRDDDDVPGCCVLDDVVKVRIALDATQRQVDDVSIVVDRPFDAFGENSSRRFAVRRDPDGEDRDAGGHAGDADPVVQCRGDDAGDVSAMAVGIDVSASRPPTDIETFEDSAGKIGVVATDAGIHHRDGHATALGGGPHRRSGQVPAVECPLQRTQRVRFCNRYRLRHADREG